MDRHLIFYYIGIFIIFASHIYLLVVTKKDDTMMQGHSYINLAAGLFIAYYFMNKEKFIDF